MTICSHPRTVCTYACIYSASITHAHTTQNTRTTPHSPLPTIWFYRDLATGTNFSTFARNPKADCKPLSKRCQSQYFMSTHTSILEACISLNLTQIQRSISEVKAQPSPSRHHRRAKPLCRSGSHLVSVSCNGIRGHGATILVKR